MGEKVATAIGGTKANQDTGRERGKPASDSQDNAATSRQSAGGNTGGNTGGNENRNQKIEVIHGVATGLGKKEEKNIPAPNGCTCGKPEGERGPHKKHCAISARNRSRNENARPAASGGKKQAAAHDADQTKVMIQTLLHVGFNISATRLGEHWKLSNEEAHNLAEPIAAILDRHDLTDKMGAYGDYIALIAAVGVIVVPKVMIHMEISKQKRGGVTNVRDIQSKQRQRTAGEGNNADAGANAGSGRPVQPAPTHNRPSDVKRSLAWLEG